MFNKEKAAGGDQAAESSDCSEDSVFLSAIQGTSALPSGSKLEMTALAYAAAGKFLFPLHPRKKTPLTPQGLKNASNSLVTILAWWKQWPEANIGLPTGEINGFWVLDVDGEDGESTLRLLEERHGVLPPTIEIITGGGGRHIYFTLPAQGVIRNSAGRLGKGLDVRGSGGFCVAPPSIHETGKAYALSTDSHSRMADAPPWLLSLVQAQGSAMPNSSVHIEWRIMLAKGVAEGERNDTIARIAGKLLRHLDPHLALELCLAWNESRCKPPLPPDEIIRTVDSIAGCELARRGGRA